MSEANKAVFLSYASQDAEAARRICEALRSGGVEVWFDADGGLEHGDEWDAKIRRQIKECVLFIPLISASTQAREEGYFRIEWELAAQRSLGIASGVAFILPVVIDDTREPDALVPDRFRAVQWTRLRGGEVPPEVLQRFLKLWSHRTGVLKHQVGGPEILGAVSRRDDADESRRNAAPVRKAMWLWLVLGLLAFGGAAYFFLGRKLPAAPPPAATAPVATADFPRDPELRRARALLFTMDAIPEDFSLAEDIVKPVVAQRPNDPEVATVAAEIAVEFLTRGFDTSAARRSQAQRQTERAAQLAPENPYALGVLARYLLFINSQLNRAEELCRRAIALRPDEARFHRTLYYILAVTKREAEADAYGEQMAGQFPHDALILYDIARRYKDANDLVQAEKWFDRTVALEHPPAFAMIWKAWFSVWAHGDLAEMKRWIDRVPERQRANARVASARFLHGLLSGDTGHALQALNEFPDEWLTDFDFTGPKSLLMAILNQQKGRADLAKVQFEVALAAASAEVQKNPTDARALRAKMWALIGLGQTEEARAIQRVLLQATRRPYVASLSVLNWANAVTSCLLLGLRDDALALLREACTDPNTRLVLRNLYKLDPRLAPWREDPEVNALLRDPEPVVALTPARELAVKAHGLFQGLEATREDFALAEDYCQRAMKLDPTDAEVWAIYAQLNAAYGYRGWDTSPERREQTRVMAERAIRLAPTSAQARIAQASAWSAFGINRAETEKLLREVLQERPDDQAVLRFLAVTVLTRGGLEECLALNERSATLPGGDPLALFNNARYLWQRGRQAEAYATLQRSLAQKSFSSALTLKAFMEIVWRGDSAAAEATLRQIPQTDLLEDRASYTAGLVYFYQRRAEAALAAWGAFPREFYSDFAFDGPKGLLLGLAHELDGHDAAAKIEWRTALQAVEKRIAAAPNKPAPYYFQAYLLACLGEKAAANEALRTYEQLAAIKNTHESPMPMDVAFIYARLGRLDEIFAQSPARFIRRLRIDPRFDALRADPRYGQLVKEFEQQEAEAGK